MWIYKNTLKICKQTLKPSNPHHLNILCMIFYQTEYPSCKNMKTDHLKLDWIKVQIPVTAADKKI